MRAFDAGRRVAELDGLRAIAVLSVMAYHLAPKVLPGGFLGVDLFFVLSGYLITSLLVDEERRDGSIDLTAFYGRRALRILPPLALAIGLALVLGVASYRAALAAAFFYANFTFRGFLEGLAHTWSLAVEEHFYLAWPLAFLAFRRHRLRLLVCVVATAILVRIGGPLFEISPGWLYQVTPARADSLAIGCIAALTPVPRKGGFAALLLIIASFVLVRLEYYGLLTLGMTVFAALCALAIVNARGRLLRSSVLTYIGRRSYALYLFHWPIFMAADRMAVSDPVRLALKALLPFIAAEINYRLVELPAMKLKRRLGLERSRALPADAATAGASIGE